MRKIKVPAIVLDIDGVVKLGPNSIFGAKSALKLLKTPLSYLFPSKFKNIHFHLPFVFLSNGGGILESTKAKELNQILNLENEDKITEKELILCNTPFKDFASEYKDKYIILTGLGKMSDIAQSYGFNKAITLDEYSAFFPFLSHLAIKEKTFLELDKLKDRCMKRLFLKRPFDSFPPIEAIFMLSDPDIWEENLQIISDLLISKDGIPGSIRRKNEKQFVKFFISNPDLVYAANFNIPRIAAGTFLYCLNVYSQKVYQRQFEWDAFGKPLLKSFKYAEKHIRKYLPDFFEISKFYMIGDNPAGDIKGANNAGWVSILVKTGIFKGLENDPQNPATKVCENVKDSIEWIINDSGISI